MLRVTSLVGFGMPAAAAGPVATHSVNFPAPGDVANSLQLILSGAASSNQVATVAGWFKTADFVNNKALLSTGEDTDRDFSDVLSHIPGAGGMVQATARFNVSGRVRSTTTITAEAWHHICWRLNMAAPTAPDRMRIEVDLVDVTDIIDAAPDSSTFNLFQPSLIHVIGHRLFEGISDQSFSGKVAELYGLDGLDVPATSFAVDDAGTPKAIQYAGPFGINGWHLKAQDAQDLGKDYSGNDHHWTTVGTGLTQSPDAPPSL